MLKWLFDSIFGSIIGGLLNFRNKKKAEDDAIKADRAEGVAKAQAESKLSKEAVDKAGRDAQNAVNPDMSDWT